MGLIRESLEKIETLIQEDKHDEAAREAEWLITHELAFDKDLTNLQDLLGAFKRDLRLLPSVRDMGAVSKDNYIKIAKDAQVKLVDLKEAIQRLVRDGKLILES